jgi:hypothetical protein
MLDGLAGLVELRRHILQRHRALLQALQLLLQLLLQARQLLRRQLVYADLLRLLRHADAAADAAGTRALSNF